MVWLAYSFVLPNLGGLPARPTLPLPSLKLITFGDVFEHMSYGLKQSFESRKETIVTIFDEIDRDSDSMISAQEMYDFWNENKNIQLPSIPSITAKIMAIFGTLWPLGGAKIALALYNYMGPFLLLFIVSCTVVPGPLHHASKHLFRWPILITTYLTITVEMVLYFALRMLIFGLETLFATPRHRRLRKAMQRARSYKEWLKFANELDESQDRTWWLETTEDEYARRYNWDFVKSLIDSLRDAREKGDVIEAMAVLQQCTRKNVGGVMSGELFSYTNSGRPKEIVVVFFKEVNETLRMLCDGAIKEKSKESIENVRKFLSRARAAYGRNALVLSGGAAMGSYHLGLVQALQKEKLLPRIISGTSAGAVIGSFVGTRTDEELARDLNVEVMEVRLASFGKTWAYNIKNLWKFGTLFNSAHWLKRVSWFTCGDLTFEEAFNKTGRVLCITISATTKKAPPVLLNYITSPNVVINSAVVCSAAVPGFINPARLKIKDRNGNVVDQAENKDQLYFDGSIEQDIPTAGLSELFNVQFFLASQCNPHILPFFFNNKGTVGNPNRWSGGGGEGAWRGGFLLSALELYLKMDMKSKFQFLEKIECTISWTGSMMTQNNWGVDSSSNIATCIPRVVFIDFFKIITDPSRSDLQRYFQGGEIAAYEKFALMKIQTSISDCLNECLHALEGGNGNGNRARGGGMMTRRRSKINVNAGAVNRSGPSTLSFSDPSNMMGTESEGIHF